MDMNGKRFKIGDKVIHHRHDPSKRGVDVCQNDKVYKVIWDSWGRVILDDLGPIYLNHLLEIVNET